jgi:hypothetical protein
MRKRIAEITEGRSRVRGQSSKSYVKGLVEGVVYKKIDYIFDNDVTWFSLVRP